jgi:phenylalanyl-tRNA synthetase alpha chain
MSVSREKGHHHPLSLVIRDFEHIFRKMGFSVKSGPEMEDEFHNFDALNVPKDHPARDMQDTFRTKGKEGMVMRTQTSNVQIRYMENNKPPIRIIAPGRTYRAEATDTRHEAVFHQIEGLAVDKDVTLGNLKGVLQEGLSTFFGADTDIRLRPGFFPFVEPGVELDARCVTCHGKGIRSGSKKCGPCKGTGWLELMGAGMVHPNVLSNVDINHREYQGFAFGVGIERLAMVKYGVDDIRLFNSADLRFVNQF